MIDQLADLYEIDAHRWDQHFDNLAENAANGLPIFFEGATPADVTDAIVIYRSGRVARVKRRPDGELVPVVRISDAKVDPYIWTASGETIPLSELPEVPEASEPIYQPHAFDGDFDDHPRAVGFYVDAIVTRHFIGKPPEEKLPFIGGIASRVLAANGYEGRFELYTGPSKPSGNRGPSDVVLAIPLDV